MKIGVITFHRAVNYGAVLQAYALQHTLQSMGAEVDILDYRCDYLEKNYSICERLRVTKSPAAFAAVLIKCALPMLKKKHNIMQWMRKKCKLSRPYRNDIVEANSCYDAFITGSDQVFNHNHTNFDKNYFLDFVRDDTRKFSYAASYGFSQLDPAYSERYKHLLASFAAISVRESSGAQLTKEILGDTVVTEVPDPVLLMQPQDWAVRPRKGKKYVLIYELMPSDAVVDFALRLAEDQGLQVIRITNIRQKSAHKRIKNVYGISPQIFLEYIHSANYVVTNSFHGTAFSILFNKQVYVHHLTDSMAPLNARLDDLLSMCGMEERVVNTYCSLEDIDYAPIRKRIERVRQTGWDFLQQIVLQCDR